MYYHLVQRYFQKMKIIYVLKADEFMKTNLRKRYLDRMIDLKDTPDIKIITGILQ